MGNLSFTNPIDGCWVDLADAIILTALKDYKRSAKAVGYHRKKINELEKIDIYKLSEEEAVRTKEKIYEHKIKVSSHEGIIRDVENFFNSGRAQKLSLCDDPKNIFLTFKEELRKKGILRDEVN